MNKRTFEFFNLLEEKEDGKISGPMSPMLLAREMVKQGMLPHFDIMARISTKQDGRPVIEINQIYEGPGKSELTGHDTLLIGSSKANVFGIFIDRGVNVCPVAIWYSDEPVTEAVTTPIYQQQPFEERFTREDIEAIFTQAAATDLQPEKLQLN